MTKEKIRLVKVMTPKGERTLVFRPVNKAVDGIICDTVCPYGDLCSKIIDPRNPDNPKLKFTDFCGDLGEDSENEENDLTEYIPVEGTIEENLYDFPDIFQTLIKNDPVVKVSDIIEKFCKDWCDSYDEEHTGCVSKNKLCMLHNLFKNNKSKQSNDNKE